MKKTLILTGFLSLLALVVSAQIRGLFVPTDNGQTEPAANEKRIALVIGNRAYNGGGWQPLRNPVNDANLMKSTLESVGFEVVTVKDASREAMITAIGQLTAKITGKQTVALVYYAGHGVEADGKNWFVPINDKSSCRDDISANCISLDFINQKLKNAGVAFNIIISDACRNNTLPFTCPASGRDGTHNGFIEFKAKGSCIAFSTAPNATAADGTGYNSPYTTALAQAIAKENLSIEGVFKQVSRDLDRLGQEPWVHNAFSGEFYFTLKSTTTDPVKDSDGDGIVDSQDACPYEFGDIAYRGCPKPKVVAPKNADFTESATGVAFTMKYLTGSTFTMGSNEADDEKPARTVRVSTFFMAKYETTNDEFCAFLNEKGNQTEGEKTWLALGTEDYYDIVQSNGRFSPKSGRGSRPVRNVSWYGATAYCAWLSDKTGKAYRLPTEEEWEFAAKGGQSYKYAGSDNVADVAWMSDNSGSTTHNVGQLQANGFGLYDMSGNVYEWCSNWYKGYPGSSGVSDYTGSRRVSRGGSWLNGPTYCRAAVRNFSTPTLRYNYLGFRVCSSLQ